MGEGSKIEWTDHTFNPWWGCARVSPACRFCYADAWAKRTGHANLWHRAGERRLFGPKHWAEPLKWNARAERDGVRRRVFCASMADVFEDHADVVQAREDLWTVIAFTPHLDWLLLTKRPENVASMVPWGERWPSNVWLGVSVEDQQRAEERIPQLLKHPAAVRFLSCEPLLEQIDLSPWLGIEWMDALGTPGTDEDGGWGQEMFAALRGEVGGGIGWIIGGGESGAKARFCDPRWARSLRDQATAAEVPFFWKQWGEYVHVDQAPADTVAAIDTAHNLSGNPTRVWRTGKKLAGRLLDEREWNEVPQTQEFVFRPAQELNVL